MNRIVIVAIIVLIIIGALVYVELNSGKHSVTTSPPPPPTQPLYIWVADAYTVEAQLPRLLFPELYGNTGTRAQGRRLLRLAREIASEGSNAQVSVFMPVALSAASPSYWGTIVPVGP
jgi:hypothetical protein